MMLEGFKKYNMTIGTASVSVTENGIAFSKSAIVKMNKARYVVLYINEDSKQIAIQECQENDEEAIDFYRGQKTISVRWNNKELLRTIENMMDWQLKGYVYRVDGDYYSKEKTMIFDLTKAEKSQSK